MKKLLQSAVAMTWLNQAVGFGWMLLVLPLILRQWTSVEVSLWLSLSLLTSLGLLADLGFRPTVARAITYAAAGIPLGGGKAAQKSIENDKIVRDSMGQLIGTIGLSYLALTLISLVLCAFPGIFVVKNIIGLGGNHLGDWLAYAVTIIQIMVTLNMGRYGGILDGLDRVAESNRIQAAFNLLRLVGVIGLILVGGQVLSLSVFSVLLLVAQSVFFSYRTRKALDLKFGQINRTHKFDRSLFAWLWAPAWRSGVIAMGSYLIGQGSTVIAAQLPDANVIASYLLTMRILGFVGQLVRVPIYARLPIMNELRARNEIRPLRDFFTQRLVLVIGLSLICIISINCLGNMVLHVVAPNKPGLLSGAPLWILSVWLLLDIHHGSHAQSYMTTNRVPFMIPALISGVLIMGVGYWAAQAHGVLGLVLVLFLVQLLFNNWFPVYLNLRSLEWSFSEYLRDLYLASIKFLKHARFTS